MTGEPTARELLARVRAADRAARAALRDQRDAHRRWQAAEQESDAAWAALRARLTPPPVLTAARLADHIAAYFKPKPAPPVPAPGPVTTCWAANPSKTRPWVHLTSPPGEQTLCGKAAGLPAGDAEATCPACVGAATGTEPQWPKPPAAPPAPKENGGA